MWVIKVFFGLLSRDSDQETLGQEFLKRVPIPPAEYNIAQAAGKQLKS